MDRLFNNVQQADPRIPKYAMIARLDFPDLLRKAMKLEISERRGDWSVPEIPIADGRIITAEPDTTDQVDEAIRRLSETQAQEASPLPSPTPLTQETAQFPALEELESSSEPPAGQEPFLTIEDENNPEKIVTHGNPSVSQMPPQHPKAQRPVRPKRRNTDVPAEQMLGDEPGKVPIIKEDPWAAPKRDSTRRVKPGATIQFGSGGVADED